MGSRGHGSTAVSFRGASAALIGALADLEDAGTCRLRAALPDGAIDSGQAAVSDSH